MLIPFALLLQVGALFLAWMNTPLTFIGAGTLSTLALLLAASAGANHVKKGWQ